MLGLITLGRKAWWFDEAYDVVLARDPWLRLVAKAGYYEPSQALYLVLFKFWRMFTPESEWFTRLPSVVTAAVAAALVGLLGARLFNRSTGVLAGCLMATNATVVAWSQQTRTYALAALAAVVVTMLVLRAVESDGRRPWLVYGLAGAIGIYAHFFIGFVLVSHLVLLPRMSAAQKRYLREAWAIIAFAFLLAVPFFAAGGHGSTDWIPPTSWHGLRVAVSTLIGFNALALAAAGVGAVAILSGRTPGAVRWKGVLLSAWAVTPLAGAIIVSVLKPMLVGRYLIVSAPAIALLGAAALSAIRPRWIAVGAATFLLAISVREIVLWYGQVPEDWRGAARFATAQTRNGVTLALYPSGNAIERTPSSRRLGGRGAEQLILCKLVDGESPLGHAFDRVLGEHATPRGFAQPPAKRLVAHERLHSVHERWNVTGRNQHPIFAGLADHLGDPADLRGDDRTGTRHRLRKDERRGLLTLRREEKHVGRSKVQGYRLVGLSPRKDHPRIYSKLTGQRLEGHPLLTVPDDHEPRARHLTVDERKRPHGVVDSLVAAQAADADE